MVATRGHRETDNDTKSLLPLRQSRESARGSLQEPDDELFWDSEDQTSKPKRCTRSTGVTFREDQSPTSSPQCRSPTESPQSLQSGATMDENSAIEGDTDTDDDLFNCNSRTRRTRSDRGKESTSSPIKREYVMNGDDDSMNEDSAYQGLRRSSRQRKFTIYDQSWLVGDKKLRGYPSMIPASEPENDEPPHRMYRQTRRYMKNMETPRAKPVRTRFHQKLNDTRRSTRYQKKVTVTTGRRLKHSNRHYQDIESELSEEEGQGRRLRTRSYNDADPSDEELVRPAPRRTTRKTRVISDDDIDTTPQSEQDKKKYKSKKKAEELVKDKNEEEAEEEEEGEEEEEREEGEEEREEAEDSKENVVKTTKKCGNRVKGNSTTQEDDREHDDGNEETEAEEKSTLIIPGKEARRPTPRAPRDPIMALGISMKDMAFEDMYSRVKRKRRPVKRFMYEDDGPQGKRKSRGTSDESDGDKEEEEEEEEEEEDDDDDDDDDDDEDDQDMDEQMNRYSLRRNRTEITPFQIANSGSSKNRSEDYRGDSPPHHHHRNRKRYLGSPARKPFSRKRRATHNSTSGSSSTSSDESQFEKRKSKNMAKARNRCLPMNLTKEDLVSGVLKDRVKIGSSLADIDPMSIDRSVTFDSVGGLSQHIKSLKEMIIFPLMYPEVFEKFKIAPPRGVLFYGPPGTGKTLVARALANECSQGDKKVAFFMRKGADCLSKWVGESERQLRLLFDQAYQMRPSIIFFDEIDGLAPVRSSRQDQIHSSIVSTLLALMDGLDSRGEVVVIGATNRIDAIDPALRRPGRFDREFCFLLPSLRARRQILEIHTKDWNPLPSKRLLHYLAEQTVGYCGADLKSLCAESALVALRARYPQIYMSKEKLLLDISTIIIKLAHFKVAMKKIVPAGHRSAASVGRKLNPTIRPLLQNSLKQVLSCISDAFPQAFPKSRLAYGFYRAHRPRMLLAGRRGQGQTTHLAPALVHTLEKVPTHKLDLAALYSVSARAPEEACAQVFMEARRSLPSIIYVPYINQWWGSTSDTLRATFISLLMEVDPASPLLLLATSEVPYEELDFEVQHMFSVYQGEVYTMSNPASEERREFFKPLFYTEMVRKPKPAAARRVLEELPVAPAPEPRQLTEYEIRKVEEVEEATLRELRIFLREICSKLARNRMFFLFTKPVDIEEVPDYLDIIKEPMDLETMMTKIDHYQYHCAQDFLNDVDLICANALEYNPDRTNEDKMIRHRACTLRDTAYAYIKAEMDSDFEEKCRDIRSARIERRQKFPKSMPEFIYNASKAQEQRTEAAVQETPPATKNLKNKKTKTAAVIKSSPKDAKEGGKSSKPYKRKRTTAWARGIATKKKRSVGEKESKKGKENMEGSKDDVKDYMFSDTSLDTPRLKKSESEEKLEDVSVDSTDNSEEEVDESKTRNEESGPREATTQVLEEAEVSLCNGHLSTEDSHDSMRVTSAVEVLAAKETAVGEKRLTANSPDSNVGKSIQHSMKAVNEDSLVSSSEQGEMHNPSVVVDWGQLESVLENCVSCTAGATVEELHQLYSVLLTLSRKHMKDVNKNELFNRVEAEICKFSQRGKS